MRLNIAPDSWASFAGKWYFSLYMDYCLELRVNRRSVSLHMRDVTREESCELIPIRATEENIIFRMKSSWLNSRLRLYPKAGEGCGEALVIEWTDGDFYELTDAQEVPQGRAVVCEPGEPLPEWAYGTWRSTLVHSYDFVLIERAEGGRFRFAKWKDWGMKPPTRSKCAYDYILDIITADASGIRYVRRGKDSLNRRVEEVIYVDEARQRLWRCFTVRKLALRQ